MMQTSFLLIGRSAIARTILTAAAVLLAISAASAQSTTSRPRASDLGLKVGVLLAGPLDAITDVAGVAVGNTTTILGDKLAGYLSLACETTS